VAEEKSKDNDQERTLDPTPRRLEKAREDGQFPQSRDLTTLLLLVVFAVVCLVAGAKSFESMRVLVASALRFSDLADWKTALNAWISRELLTVGGWVVVFIGSSWICALLAPLSMVSLRPYFVFKFRTEKLNPITGFSRLFSVDTLQETLKNVLKVTLIFFVAALYIYLNFQQIFSLFSSSNESALTATLNFIIFGALFIFAPLVLIGIIDVGLQRFQFMKRMKLTPEELKQELKETEGSPDLRQQRRKRQMQLASSRMMAALERADVVITNPDHYAVALRYDEARMRAPVVVAKGSDDIAINIREKAKELGIPLAEIPPLARVLYRSLKLGQAIPASLFEAIAEVIAWAYRTKSEPSESLNPPAIDVDEDSLMAILQSEFESTRP
jgi:flagellar biosynthesis protein FlhB